MKNDTIEKTIEIEAPLPRVWRALTTAEEFGEWFGVKPEVPFVEGKEAYGQITYPGFEHVTWRAMITKITPQTYFSYTWHPYAIDPGVDYSHEPQTLVEFFLKPTASGTHLTVRETGFEKIPAHRRPDAFRMNDHGWAEQVGNIRDHVLKAR
jgi:uncharacterized protein YndB with AHSA1/START domain